MKQFLVQQEPDGKGFLRLEGADYHYLARVRRLKIGSGFPALLPDGSTVHLEVREDDGRGLLVQCAAGTSASSDLAFLPPLYLFQAVPKGAKLDLVVRQAAECGAAAIIPFFAKRCQTREVKIPRLQKIIREARQQSGSGVATRLEGPFSFEAALERWRELSLSADRAAALFLHEMPLQKTSFHEALATKPAAAALAIGPEGGFCGEEADCFLQAGWTPIRAGTSIFRCETAALYALASARTILLERHTWQFP